MNNINWKVRLRNKSFWLTALPAAALLAQQAAALCGVQLDLAGQTQQALGVVNALFALLAVLGVVNDPTTPGLADSQRAMGYTEPGKLR